MKNLRDQQKIDSEYIPRNFKKSKTKATKVIVNRVVVQKKQEISVYSKNEVKSKKFSIKDFIFWIIFFLFPVLKTSS